MKAAIISPPKKIPSGIVKYLNVCQKAVFGSIDPVAQIPFAAQIATRIKKQVSDIFRLLFNFIIG